MVLLIGAYFEESEGGEMKIAGPSSAGPPESPP